MLNPVLEILNSTVELDSDLFPKRNQGALGHVQHGLHRTQGPRWRNRASRLRSCHLGGRPRIGRRPVSCKLGLFLHLRGVLPGFLRWAGHQLVQHLLHVVVARWVVEGFDVNYVVTRSTMPVINDLVHSVGCGPLAIDDELEGVHSLWEVDNRYPLVVVILFGRGRDLPLAPGSDYGHLLGLLVILLKNKRSRDKLMLCYSPAQLFHSALHIGILEVKKFLANCQHLSRQWPLSHGEGRSRLSA
mmetsp:Transcript_35956/g.56114  ORF Transcript_35956/g.56114 Transcript_35956/m.56114 type:complete len:244 (-) Transcript_35956:66-797(-)